MVKWTIIVFGATGDLGKRRLFPALYTLALQGNIGLIIGTGRENEGASDALEKSRPFIRDFDEEAWATFKSLFIYQKLDFESHDDFIKLDATIDKESQDRGFKSDNRLAYLASAADYFCAITHNLTKSGIIEAHNKNQRIVYEKPFGFDAQSAHAINMCIKEHLSEQQVYRIDHYLAKEFVNNIFLMRYANTLFKEIWNNKSIETVKILFHEKRGIEKRGAYYDHYGALKDVVQNHMLQLLALTTMDAPSSLDADSIRDKKAEILRSIHVADGILGQYEGYRNEVGVRPDSKTETYALIKLFVEHPQWYGVPFYLETGKELERKSTEIQLILKPVTYCLWRADYNKGCAPNVITINLTPDEGFSLRVNSKKPGTFDELTTVTFNFGYSAIFGPTSPEAYEILLQEVMAGHQSIAVRFDEIEYQWKIIDKIYAMHLKLVTYKKGLERPPEADQLMNGGNL